MSVYKMKLTWLVLLSMILAVRSQEEIVAVPEGLVATQRPEDTLKIAALNERLTNAENDVKECKTSLEAMTAEKQQLTDKVKHAEDVGDAAQKAAKEEAKASVKAEQQLAEYKRTHIEALAVEIKARELAQREVLTERENRGKLAKELQEHKEAVDLLKNEMAKEMTKTLDIRDEAKKVKSELAETLASLEQLLIDHKELKAVHDQALDHLAHPMLADYLKARGNELGVMRPELRAALEKARAVIRVPEDVAKAVAQGKDVLLQSHESLRSNVIPFVGDKHASTVTLIVISLLMAPPVYAVVLFVRGLQRRLQAQHFVLVLNFLAMCFFLAMGISSILFHVDVLQSVQQGNPATYTLLQLMILAFFLVHLGWSVVYGLVVTPTNVQIGQWIHILVSLAIITHYYENIWSKAMLDQDHQVHVGTFFLYALVYMLGLVPAMLAAAYTKVESKRS
ncbi:hypothetical protein THRCLA_20386 [Thraustotheca clavata]|uniref:Transmembrane protein n=1 Tax=Thraustotheca clavata TaxID=74557 RepID=A0A1W0A7X9_9STRA|nr:hypothetical protein THRCLA_20386 [Thraustotheca clavata]